MNFSKECISFKMANDTTSGKTPSLRGGTRGVDAREPPAASAAPHLGSWHADARGLLDRLREDTHQPPDERRADRSIHRDLPGATGSNLQGETRRCNENIAVTLW